MAGEKKSDPKKPETSTQDRSANVYVGVALEINKRAVQLAPSTPVNKIDEFGLELELPENLYLGKLSDGIDALVRQFSKDFKFDDLKKDAASIPALGKLVEKVGNAEITIEDLHIKIPPKPKADAKTPPADSSTLYTVSIAATWSQTEAAVEEKLAEGFDFTLKGIYLMVSNETREEIEMRRARSKAIQKKAQEAMILEAAFNNEAAKPAVEKTVVNTADEQPIAATGK